MMRLRSADLIVDLVDPADIARLAREARTDATRPAVVVAPATGLTGAAPDDWVYVIDSPALARSAERLTGRRWPVIDVATLPTWLGFAADAAPVDVEVVTAAVDRSRLDVTAIESSAARTRVVVWVPSGASPGARRRLRWSPRAARADRLVRVASPHAPARSIGSVGVVVVTYNSADEIGTMLDSIPRALTGLSCRIVVVDNGSSDSTREIVRARSDCVLVESPTNGGFAAGVNRGRRELAGSVDAVAILNPDLVLADGALRRLAAALVDPAVGVAVPRVLDSSGQTFHSLRRRPRLLAATGEAAFGRRWSRRPVVLTDTLRDETAYAADRDVEWASGAAWLVAADCDTAVGDWDESYFLYSEETDYARRVHEAGWRIRYCPEARVSHVGGASGSSPTLDALLAVNRVHEYAQTHSAMAGLGFRGVALLQAGLRVRQPWAWRAIRALTTRNGRAGLLADATGKSRTHA